jgi:hypothetical protein
MCRLGTGHADMLTCALGTGHADMLTCALGTAHADMLTCALGTGHADMLTCAGWALAMQEQPPAAAADWHSERTSRSGWRRSVRTGSGLWDLTTCRAAQTHMPSLTWRSWKSTWCAASCSLTRFGHRPRHH